MLNKIELEFNSKAEIKDIGETSYVKGIEIKGKKN